MKFLVGVLLLAAGSVAYARIGETRAQCTAHYGKPVNDALPDRTIYQSNGWYITVLFSNGVVTGEKYAKVQTAEIGLDDLFTLLKLEGGDQRWTAPLPDGGGNVKFSCERLDSSLSKDRLTLLIGTRDCVAEEIASAKALVTPTPSTPVQEDVLVTLSGKTYKGARFSRAQPGGIVIFYVGGVASIQYEDLPGDWRLKYLSLIAAATPEPTAAPMDTPAASSYATGGYYDTGGSSGGSTYVNGYYRKDGTYVHGYTRSRR